MNKKTFIYFAIFILFSSLVAGKVLFYSQNVSGELLEASFGKYVKPQRETKFLKMLDDVKAQFISDKTDFLEANLEEMKLRIFREGMQVKEAEILAKGDPQGWGGSAAGLHKIESGHKISFSNIAEVYMPYALHYFGKYYIHGEPYYPGGEKLESVFSGGCLRLTDEDAKDVYELVDLNMPVLVIDKNREDYLENSNTRFSKIPAVSAKSYLLADLGSGQVFAEKNLDTPLPIASLTKLMTSLVVTENVNLERSVIVTQKALDAGYGSTENMESGDELRVVELLYPLLIESSNDAAEVLTSFLGREKTIRLMNEKAKSILMENSRFVGPSGFDPGNISTAQDLFYLARYILNNRPPIWEITKGNKVTSFGSVSFDLAKLWNKNVFTDDPTFLGGKTGYTKQADSTALFIFKFEDKEGKERDVAFAILGSKSLKNDTHLLYSWLAANYFKDSLEVVQ